MIGESEVMTPTTLRAVKVSVLIRSKGWKEMHFISPTTDFLYHLYQRSKGWRPQPTEWDRAITRSHDKEINPEVRMYIANSPRLAGLAENPQTRTAYNSGTGPLAARNPKLRGLRGPLDDLEAREVLVVAKRGKDAPYVQDGSFMNDSLKGLLEKMKWQEIRNRKYYNAPNKGNPALCLIGGLYFRKTKSNKKK
jgi:hypothetical protein